KHNCLRHSTISYRVALEGDIARIADESGNSPYVIRRNYLNRRKPWQAAQWFGIMPGDTSKPVLLPTPDEAKATAEKMNSEGKALAAAMNILRLPALAAA